MVGAENRFYSFVEGGNVQRRGRECQSVFVTGKGFYIGEFYRVSIY